MKIDISLRVTDLDINEKYTIETTLLDERYRVSVTKKKIKPVNFSDVDSITLKEIIIDPRLTELESTAILNGLSLVNNLQIKSIESKEAE